jgi:endoglucanase
MPSSSKRSPLPAAAEGIWAANDRLARTINLGLGFDPSSRRWGVELTEEHFDLCAEAGFTAVRLLVDFASQAQPGSPYRIRPELLDRVAWSMEQASRRGLALAVCNFVYPDLMADPASHKDRLLAIVEQISARCQDAPGTVILEPLAEPHDNLDPVWNRYLADIVAVVRDRHPTRPLIVGPAFYNTVLGLPSLELPDDDPNLIVTIHQYWPIEFTFQGEEWFTRGDPKAWLGNTWQGDRSQRQELDAGFAKLADWARSHGRPVFMGEFGTTNHADMPSRVRWTLANRVLAEKHGFSWGCWSFGPTYALYDHQARRWHHDLLAALFSESPDEQNHR